MQTAWDGLIKKQREIFSVKQTVSYSKGRWGGVLCLIVFNASLKGCSKIINDWFKLVLEPMTEAVNRAMEFNYLEVS